MKIKIQIDIFEFKVVTITSKTRHKQLGSTESKILNGFVGFSKEMHENFNNSADVGFENSTKNIEEADNQKKNWFLLLIILLVFKIVIDILENI